MAVWAPQNEGTPRILQKQISAADLQPHPRVCRANPEVVRGYNVGVTQIPLPIAIVIALPRIDHFRAIVTGVSQAVPVRIEDRKSTRLNSSHVKISYAVFCLKT